MPDESKQNDNNPSVTSEAPKPRGPKLQAHYALPLSGYETLVKTIKGYAVASNGGANPVGYKDVASATGLPPTVVSRNNGFLTESNIITSPKYGLYLPSEEAVKFAREAAWDEPNAKAHLRAAVGQSWYAQVVAQNFATRATLTRDDMKRVLAIKSGASEGDAESLGRLIDFIQYLGVISEGENGAFTRGAISDGFAKQQQGSAAEVSTSESLSQVAGPSQPATSVEISQIGENGGVTVRINLNVAVTSVGDLTEEDAWKLRRWLQIVTGQQPEA